MSNQDFDQDFPDQPPFPADVPTAPLLRLSLRRLLDGDAAEQARLWQASCELGFFYLDLRDVDGSGSGSGSGMGTDSGSNNDNDNDAKDATIPASLSRSIDGPAFLQRADELFAASDAIFALPTAEKQKYDYAARGSYFGYKGYGSGSIDGSGASTRRDRNEFFNIAKDDVLGIARPLAYPAVLDAFRPALRDFMQTAHAVSRAVLHALDRGLGLPAGTLAAWHRLEAESGDQVRWVSAAPQPAQDRRTALGAHTDYGSVTVLFNRLGGLQVLKPGAGPAAAEEAGSVGGGRVYEDGNGNGGNGGSGGDGGDKAGVRPPQPPPLSLEDVPPADWLYVRPLPGHCIVNLGDALVKFSAGVLRSNVHRVVNPPGAQQHCTRTSLVYFARPEDHVRLAPVRGSALVDARRAAKRAARLAADGKPGGDAGNDDDDDDDDANTALTSKEWILRRALGRRGDGSYATGQAAAAAQPAPATAPVPVQ